MIQRNIENKDIIMFNQVWSNYIQKDIKYIYKKKEERNDNMKVHAHWNHTTLELQLVIIQLHYN